MAATAELSPEQYRLVDSVPEIAQERQQVRDRATTLLESRRSSSDENPEIVFLPIDALSTADQVLAAEREYGEGSEQHRDRYKGLVLDCERLVGEWYRKKKPERFERVRQKYDPLRLDYFSHGFSLRQMTERAVVPMPDNPEEEARRVNEKVEEETVHIVRRLGGTMLEGAEIRLRTVSECTDKAINDFTEDMRLGRPHAGYDGYVPEIEKVMIRDISFDTDSNDRFEEQVGLPGMYITHYIIQRALERRQVDADHLDKTALHGSQILVHDDLMSFVALLDEVASEEWCTNVFMGEKVSPDFEKDYDQFRREAEERREAIRDLTEKTAQFVLDLARDNFDRKKAPAHVENFVKILLLEEAKRDVVVAEQMFDKKTAEGLQIVASLESQGRYDEAFRLMQKIEKEAPGGGFCGAGSCGLESINTKSEETKDLLKKVKAEDGDTVLRDKERACRCGKKSIVYAYNKNKVKKYCESCGAFESKVSKVA